MISVAPLAGAWIEITENRDSVRLRLVAPLAGAWIEIMDSMKLLYFRKVAPLAGAWIEIPLKLSTCYNVWSLPSRERGLK